MSRLANGGGWRGGRQLAMKYRAWFFPILLFLLFAGCRQSAPATQDDGAADIPTSTDDVADETLDQTEVDEGDIAKLPTRCIENWPVDPKATPSPSLPIDNAGQVLWTKEVPGGSFEGPLAMAGERLAYVVGNTLTLVDRGGELVNTFMDPSSFGAVNGPVADTNGNFYFGTANLISVTPDGEPRWRFVLGPDISQVAETTYTSQLTLSPDGILYFSATDGFLYALRASDGELVWKRQVGLNKSGTGPLKAGYGIGDTIVTVRGHYHATTGEMSASPVVDGTEYWVGLASFSGLIAYYWDEAHYTFRIHALDRCSEPKWSFPTDKYMDVVLAGFDDSLVGIYGDAAFIYSATGEQQAGPAPLDFHYYPKAIGADGTLYYTYCTELYNKDAGEMSVQAYSPSLELLWSVELGKPCLDEPPVLADDGVLYVLRWKYTPDVHLELTAIQTASPGLANTAYPTLRSNNRRTGWIGGPQ